MNTEKESGLTADERLHRILGEGWKDRLIGSADGKRHSKKLLASRNMVPGFQMESHTHSVTQFYFDGFLGNDEVSIQEAKFGSDELAIFYPKIVSSMTYLPTKRLSTEYRASLEESLDELAKHFSTRIDTAIVTLLRKAASEIDARTYSDLDDAIFEGGERISEAGFQPNAVVIPRRLTAFMVRTGITEFDHVRSTGWHIHYSKELEDEILVLDTTECGTIAQQGIEIDTFHEPRRPITYAAVRMRLPLVAVVERPEAVALIRGVNGLVARHRGLLRTSVVERCLFSDRPCGRRMGFQQSCFVALPAKGYEKEEEIIAKLLDKEFNIACVVAIREKVPNENAMCVKICGQIIESRFCIALLDRKRRRGRGNANVFMEYGIMTALRKPTIPATRRTDPLPFNAAWLDALIYNDETEFESLMREWIAAMLAKTQV